MNIFHSEPRLERLEQRIAGLFGACVSALGSGYREVSRRSTAIWSAMQLKARHLWRR